MLERVGEEVKKLWDMGIRGTSIKFGKIMSSLKDIILNLKIFFS